MDGQPHEVHMLEMFKDAADVAAFEDALAVFLDEEMPSRGGYSFSVKPLEEVNDS